MKKILLLALIVLVYQGQNKAALSTLPLPTFSTEIKHMIATLLAFGGGYQVAKINIDYRRNNDAPVIPYVLKALSAGLISVGGLGFLGKEPSDSAQTFYASTLVLGALMGARSSNFEQLLTVYLKQLLAAKDEVIQTKSDLETTLREYNASLVAHLETLNHLDAALRGHNTTPRQLNNEIENSLTSEQNAKPATLIKSNELIQLTESVCTVCQYPLLESEHFLIKLKCGHFLHQLCNNQWLAQKPFCPLCHKCLIATSGRITDNHHRFSNQDHKNTA